MKQSFTLAILWIIALQESSRFWKLSCECAESQAGDCNHISLGEALCLAVGCHCLVDKGPWQGAWSWAFLSPHGSWQPPTIRLWAKSQRLLNQELWVSCDLFLLFLLRVYGKVSQMPFYFQNWERGYVYGLSWLLTMLFTYLEAYRPSSCHQLCQIP